MGISRRRPRPKKLISCLLFLVVVLASISICTRKLQERWTRRKKALKLRDAKARLAEESGIAHPIPILMAQAEDRYREKLRRQSKTLTAAAEEYRRRYGRAPPKGFDKWFEFAKANKVRMIDEYDGMMEDLKPFWELSGHELRYRAFQLVDFPMTNVVLITNGTIATLEAVAESPSTRSNAFKEIIAPFLHKLPDMAFPINERSDCRVLVPHQQRMHTDEMTFGNLDSLFHGGSIKSWETDRSLWEEFRRTCSPKSEARRVMTSFRNPTRPSHNNYTFLNRPGFFRDPAFAFVENVDDSFDFCSHPWAHWNQGHFYADLPTIPALYPMFSYGKAPGFMDIRIPSHYYYKPSSSYTYGYRSLRRGGKESDTADVPWENKTNVMIWRGTTRGGSTPRGYAHNYHRHRLVQMANDESAKVHTVVFRDPESSSFVHTKVPVNELNQEMMDVAFVDIHTSKGYDGGTQAMYEDYRFSAIVPLSDLWKHRYLIDVDGEGYSARFFAFLASGSVPIKSTLYKEFFSDWIQPWLHFVPMSQFYNEIYNIYSFFNGPTPSMMRRYNASASDDAQYNVPEDKLLRRIAVAGQTWKRTQGRKVDMEAYLYRLALEWGRLWQDDRKAMDLGARKVLGVYVDNDRP